MMPAPIYVEDMQAAERARLSVDRMVKHAHVFAATSRLARELADRVVSTVPVASRRAVLDHYVEVLTASMLKEHQRIDEFADAAEARAEVEFARINAALDDLEPRP